MSFNPGPYRAFPATETRPETPPLEIDTSNPFVGIEIIVSGLPRTSLTAAHDRLKEIIQELLASGAQLPFLDIVSPAHNDPLDYVWVSLSSPLRETPRPDILEDVRALLNTVPGLCARWRVSNSKVDKTRQVFFTVDENVDSKSLKAGLDAAFASRHLEVQSSWFAKDLHKIFYLFTSIDAPAQLREKNPVVGKVFHIPRTSRFIQPKFGLEVAVNGVGDLPQARNLINLYLQRTYGGETGEPVVRDSRLELNGSIYCAILRTPHISDQFTSNPFTLFADIADVFKVDKPRYLYHLNSQGVPTFTPNRNPAPAQDPLLQHQINNLSATTTGIASTLEYVVQRQQQYDDRVEQDRLHYTNLLHEVTAYYALNNLLTSTQMEATTLNMRLDQQENLKIMLPAGDPRIQDIDRRATQIQIQLEGAESRKRTIMDNIQANQLTVSTPATSNILASITSLAPSITAAPPNPPPMLPQPSETTKIHQAPKRPRMMDNNGDQQEVQAQLLEMAKMPVDEPIDESSTMSTG